MKQFTLSFFLLLTSICFSQVVLKADGSNNTYELINSVFANPNRNVVEVPDCNHDSFGRHITQVFDTTLNKYVFQFHIHVSPDNDRCQKFDRQRNEIKTYSGSPENTIARRGETVTYEWLFKISDDFQPSSSFTHIHQIKSVDGPLASLPMYTLTLRKGNPDQLELRYSNGPTQGTLKKTDLTPFKGKWLKVKEVITFDDNNAYFIEIKDYVTDATLFTYVDATANNWHEGASFIRPKWGIYRSLNNQQDLKDEIVLFADFSIEENTQSLSVDMDAIKSKAEKIVLFLNPSSNKVAFRNTNLKDFESINVYDYSGKEISIKDKIADDKLDVSEFSKGLYFIVLKKDSLHSKVLKCYVK